MPFHSVCVLCCTGTVSCAHETPSPPASSPFSQVPLHICTGMLADVGTFLGPASCCLARWALSWRRVGDGIVGAPTPCDPSPQQGCPRPSPNTLEAKDDILPGEFTDSFEKIQKMGCVLTSGTTFFLKEKATYVFLNLGIVTILLSQPEGKGSAENDWQKRSKIKRQVFA